MDGICNCMNCQWLISRWYELGFFGRKTRTKKENAAKERKAFHVGSYNYAPEEIGDHIASNQQIHVGEEHNDAIHLIRRARMMSVDDNDDIMRQVF